MLVLRGKDVGQNALQYQHTLSNTCHYFSGTKHTKLKLSYLFYLSQRDLNTDLRPD